MNDNLTTQESDILIALSKKQFYWDNRKKSVKMFDKAFRDSNH